MKPPSRYEVTVKGHDPVYYNGYSLGKIRAKAWRAYTCAYDCTFKRWLQIAKFVRVENPHLKRVLVQGRPAWQVDPVCGNSVPVWIDGNDYECTSRELDVEDADNQPPSENG